MPDQNVKATQELEETIQTKAAFDTANHSTESSVWQQVVEIGTQVSEEEWVKLPSDLSKNIKH